MGLRRLLHSKIWFVAAAIALSPSEIGLGHTHAFGHAFPSAQAPLPTAIASHPAQPPFPIAQQSRIRRIQFAAGKSSAMLQDAVVRGTRDIYLLAASKGQTMTVKIASIENNASFEITTPANKSGFRRTLTPDAVNWTGVLPTSGDYRIMVGGSRGNATYKLQVTIR